MKKAIITVSENMSENTFRKLSDGVRKKYGDDISIVRKTDNKLLGGFILTVDGIVYDNSVSSQLKKIKKELND